MTPHPARYEARKAGERGWAVWDSFVQEFVSGESYPSWSQALSATGRMNRAYAGAPVTRKGAAE